MALALIKLSLLFQYLRVLNENPDTKQPKTRIAIIFLIVATSVWGVVYSILAWVPCIPVEGHWNFDESATRYGYGSDEIGPFVATCTYMSTPGVGLFLLSQSALYFQVWFHNKWLTHKDIIHGACNMIIDIAVLAIPVFSRSMWVTADEQLKSRMAMIGLYILGGL